MSILGGGGNQRSTFCSPHEKVIAFSHKDVIAYVNPGVIDNRHGEDR